MAKQDEDEQDSDLDDVLERAQKSDEAKDFATARRLAQKVVDADPKGHPDAYVVLGDAEADGHDDAKALALYDKALSLDATNGDAVVGGSAALDRMGRKDDGRKRLRAFLTAHPNADADVWDALGDSELEATHAANAEAAFRSALRVSKGKDSDALYAIATIVAARGDVAGTERALKALFAVSPGRKGEAARDEAFDPVRDKPAIQKLLQP
jgi:tetratricopeptide (TPR) repeat protein